MKKGILVLLLAALLANLLINSAFALTGSIGNAKMFLDAEVGETLEKYVLVKNVNNVSVKIELNVASDIAKDVKLEDEEFILGPGEERKAYFTIKARKPGVYEIRIQVRFSSLEEGKTGVGLASVITLKVYGKGELPEDEGKEDNVADNEEVDITGSAIGEKKLNPVIVIMPIITLILLVVFLFVLIKTKKRKYKQNKTNKKRADRSL